MDRLTSLHGTLAPAVSAGAARDPASTASGSLGQGGPARRAASGASAMLSKGVILMLLGLLACLATTVEAGKPGGTGGTGGGTIHYRFNDQSWSMNSDGSGKTQILAAQPSNVQREPSSLLHGGLRWFLELREVVGEIHPNGKARRAVYSVRGDGNEAATRQLTADPGLEIATTQWIPGDGEISWLARRWVAGVVTQGGVYAAGITFDGSGNVIELVTQPATPTVPAGLVPWADTSGPWFMFSGDLGPDIRAYDWSPSGTEAVHGVYSNSGLWIADRQGARRLLLASSPALGPVWSPTGDKIAFDGPNQSIFTILTSGGSLLEILRSNANPANASKKVIVGNPKWSPTGSHLAYRRMAGTGFSGRTDVYRATPDGGNQTNLTGDLGGSTPYSSPVGWR